MWRSMVAMQEATPHEVCGGLAQGGDGVSAGADGAVAVAACDEGRRSLSGRGYGGGLGSGPGAVVEGA